MAECPSCGHQMLSCGRHFDEYGPLDPDDGDEDWDEWEGGEFHPAS